MADVFQNYDRQFAEILTRICSLEQRTVNLEARTAQQDITIGELFKEVSKSTKMAQRAADIATETNQRFIALEPKLETILEESAKAAERHVRSVTYEQEKRIVALERRALGLDDTELETANIEQLRTIARQHETRSRYMRDELHSAIDRADRLQIALHNAVVGTENSKRGAISKIIAAFIGGGTIVTLIKIFLG